MKPEHKPRFLNSRYALTPTFRSGGMSDVILAMDVKDDSHKVAVKLFKHDSIEESVAHEAFAREVRALGDLKHPAIVELLDSGRDEETGRQFLVLEWMKEDLPSYLKDHPVEGWDTFAEEIAFPLLEGLSFAHGRNYAHRDIKPHNILIGPDGRPKLADFGISKLRTYLRPGITLADFVSRPFTPPEAQSEFFFARDIFGFAMLVLSCLSDVDILDYDDIKEAVEGFDAPPDVIRVFERALSFDPAKRHLNASLLLLELQALQARRKKSFELSVRKPCYIEMLPKARRQLRDEFGLFDDQDVERTVIEDLNTECGIRRYKGTALGEGAKRTDDDHYYLYGVRCRYHVALDRNDRDRFIVFRAWESPGYLLERLRDQSWIAPLEFRIGRPSKSASADALMLEVADHVDQHEANRRAADAQERERHLFRAWRDILQVKSDAEHANESPLTYGGARVDGDRVVLQLTQEPSDDFVGQSRRIQLPNDRRGITGRIGDVRGREAVLYVSSGNAAAVPASGILVVDTFAALNAIRRQIQALEAILASQAARADIGHLLARPADASPPRIEQITFFQEDLDDAQKAATVAAVGTHDFLAVEGPPGTGKTKFIVELVLQTLAKQPEARILLSSQTHVALDNALERIRDRQHELKLVRIGHADDPRISRNISDLLLDSQMEVWREEVKTRGHAFLSSWAAEHGLSEKEVRAAVLFKELSVVNDSIRSLEESLADTERQTDHLASRTRTGRDEEGSAPPVDDLDPTAVLEARLEEFTHTLRTLRKDRAALDARVSELDEDLLRVASDPGGAADEWVERLLGANPQARKLEELMTLHADWVHRLGSSRDFDAAFLARSQVVAGTCIGIDGARGIEDIQFDLCILDEASKATATEALVPLARSRRWVLVGDQKQLPPFQDEALRRADRLAKYDLTPEDLKETIFDRLLAKLPAPCKKSLSIQHRMVPPIGRLVSFCFYDKALESSDKDLDPIIGKLLPRPVTWFSTSRQQNRRERQDGPSFVNICEAGIVINILGRLNDLASDAGRTMSVAVLTGYSSQRDTLRRTLAYDTYSSLEIECNTVDAFQGREADVAVYSITRSNQASKLGFLREEERLNVALSRARVGLIIVGDHVFCRGTPTEHPLKRVVDHVERFRDDCALEVLES